MDADNGNDEQSQSILRGAVSTKLGTKDRSRTQAIPTNTDINDPENLDYEDTDDNHHSEKLEGTREKEQINTLVTKINEETKSSMNIQVR